MLLEYCKKVHDQQLLLRSISRILKTDRFYEAFQMSSLEQRKILFEILDNYNHVKLERWIKDRLEIVTMQQLRSKAKELQIPRYFRLSKESLLSEIHNATNRITHGNEESLH